MVEVKSNKTAFTLLEILVVMAIIGVLLYMIVQAMSNFRRSVELQQASDQIISAINETKNFAGNNILPDGITIDDDKVYAYRLAPTDDGSNITRKVCSRVVGSTLWDCSISSREDYLVAEFLQNVIITPVGCTNALLINMTNDWQYETEGLGYTDAGACHFELSHKQDPSVFRTFVFDAVKNTFETKYQDAT